MDLIQESSPYGLVSLLAPAFGLVLSSYFLPCPQILIAPWQLWRTFDRPVQIPSTLASMANGLGWTARPKVPHCCCIEAEDCLTSSCGQWGLRDSNWNNQERYGMQLYMVQSVHTWHCYGQAHSDALHWWASHMQFQQTSKFAQEQKIHYFPSFTPPKKNPMHIAPW